MTPAPGAPAHPSTLQAALRQSFSSDPAARHVATVTLLRSCRPFKLCCDSHTGGRTLSRGHSSFAKQQTPVVHPRPNG